VAARSSWRRAGHDIALVDLLEPEMQRTAGEIGAIGRKASHTRPTWRSSPAPTRSPKTWRGRWGRIDFLLNDAGASTPRASSRSRGRVRPHHRRSTSRAASTTSRHRADHAEAGIGWPHRQHVVLNALSGGVTSAVSKHAYAAAKAGILGLTRSLAKELGPAIMINAICPGVIETELGNSLTRSRGEEMKKGIMLNRLGTPADVAQLVAFLATSEPCFITGQHFVIDGFQWSC
jgi:3-oxoacyl-[acyl-carrier protein] reductase